MKSDQEYYSIRDRALEHLKNIPGVTAVGLGGKEIDGKSTGEVVIKVFVKKKINESEIPVDQMIPKEFYGVPTDIVEMAEMTEFSGVPGLPQFTSTNGADEHADKGTYRPLMGGCQILRIGASKDLAGTLGCIVEDIDDTKKIYALTNQHVIKAKMDEPVKNKTKMGQPTEVSGFSDCCSGLIGKYADGMWPIVADCDSALIQLEPGMQYCTDIIQIGVVKGIYTVTVADASTNSFQVRMRGRTSKLVGGVVVSVGAIPVSGPLTVGRTNSIIIKPNKPASAPAHEVYFFGWEGDSGSAVVNKDNKIIGILYGGPERRQTALSSYIGYGLADPIQDIINAFKAKRSIKIKVATDTVEKKLKVVPKAAREAIAESESVSTVPAEASPEVNKVEVDLEKSSLGRELKKLWEKHGKELASLVRNDRKVAAVWHRSGFASLVNSFIQGIRDPGIKIPEEIFGQPVKNCFNRMYKILQQCGSNALKLDLMRVRPALPDIGGLSYGQIIYKLSED